MNGKGRALKAEILREIEKLRLTGNWRHDQSRRTGNLVNAAAFALLG
jgi:hypothetical protein